MRRILAMAGFTLLMLGGTMFAQQYKNPNLPVEERAADLCRRLTLEEKVALMQNASPAIPRLDIPQFEWWSEALRCGTEWEGDGFSRHYRYGCLFQ